MDERSDLEWNPEKGRVAMRERVARTGPTYHRALETVLWTALWPTTESGFSGPDANRRCRAIAEVLRRLPDDWYERLLQQAASDEDSFSWFIPHPLMRAGLWPFPVTVHPPDEIVLPRAPHARMLYLSPMLERAADAIVVAEVAHELAHIALAHHVGRMNDYEAQEAEAWALVQTWGFVREERRHWALRVRQDKAERHGG
ncbi:MAG TPA: hypothetical protein VKZ50_13345 [bacterium]|nr:hypothetical protein [bacterium]